MDYTAEIDNIDKSTWVQILLEFNDANIYQTWSYGAIRWGDKNLSHLLLKSKGEIVAAAQARIVKLPFLPVGIAYVRWGGMWQRKGRQKDITVFRQMLLALRQEYADRRGLFLRILPNIMNKDAQELIDILKEEGFERRTPPEGGRTLFVDLRYSLEELRANLRRGWRRQLQKAERKCIGYGKRGSRDSFPGRIEAYGNAPDRHDYSDRRSFAHQKLLHGPV